VERNQKRIDDLILDMLNYSKEREPAVEPTDLNKLCEDVLDLVRGRATDRGTAIEFRPGALVSAVPCDPEGIHRAVLNLVTNALDALEDREGGKLGVQALLEPDGAWAKIIVIDNGPGIPPEQLDDIFKPFVSTKGSKGTGLGLPVSRKVVREHGGDILVQSVPDVGSKFTIRLPVQAAPPTDTGTAFELPPDERNT
jgi:signal transduction histidine kinase